MAHTPKASPRERELLSASEEGGANPFERLPREVLALVFQHLDTADKAALRSACKAGRELCNAHAKALSLGTRYGYCPLSSARNALDLMGKLPSLTSVQLGTQDHPLPSAWLAEATYAMRNRPAGAAYAMTPFRGVRKLMLYTKMMSNKSWSQLLRFFPNLRELHLGADILPTNLGCAIAEHSPQLEELSLAFWEVTGNLPEPQDPEEAVCVEEALRTAAGLPGPAAATLSSLHGLQNLSVLRLTALPGIPPYVRPVEPLGLQYGASCMAALAVLGPRLRQLHWGLGWSWQGLQAVARHLTALTSLQLDGKSQGPVATGLGRDGEMPSLAELRLPDERLDDQVWDSVLTRLPSLRIAQFYGAELTAPPARPLACLEELHLGREPCRPAPEPERGSLSHRAALYAVRALPAVRSIMYGHIHVIAHAGTHPASLAAELSELDTRVGRLDGPTDLLLVLVSTNQTASAFVELLRCLRPLPYIARHLMLSQNGLGGVEKEEPASREAWARAFELCFPNIQTLDLRTFRFADAARSLEALHNLPTLRRLRFIVCQGLSVGAVHRLACGLSRAVEGRGGCSADGERSVELVVVRCAGMARAASDMLAAQSAAHPHVNITAEYGRMGSLWAMDS